MGTLRKIERRTAIMRHGDNNEKTTKVGLVAIQENGYFPDDYFFDYDEGETVTINRNDGDGYDPLDYGKKPWFLLPQGFVDLVMTFDDENNNKSDDFDTLYNTYLDTCFPSKNRAEAKMLCDRVIKLGGKEAFAKEHFHKIK